MSDYQDDDNEVYDPDEVTQLPPRPVRAPTPEAPRQVVLPIGEAETEETMHGVVAFTRSLALGQSRNDVAHFRVELPFVVQPGWSPDQCAAAAADAFFQIKAVVLEQAGLEFTVDEGGVLHEVVRKHFPEARAEPERDGAEPRQAPTQFLHPRDIPKPRHVNADVWQDLCDHFDEWWDNRPKKANGEYKSTASDFKRPDDQVSVWLNPPRRTAAGSSRPSSN